jgi:hypothetical protein
MAKDEKSEKPAPSVREAKLAQALRANLRRRKAGDRGATKPAIVAKSVDES